MALAGTRLIENEVEVTWKDKEIQEQQLVQDYIDDALNGLNLKFDKFKTKDHHEVVLNYL